MRSFLLGIAVTIGALALAAWACVAAGFAPINADAPPSSIERWAARTAVITGVQRQMTRGENPVSGDASLMDGIHVYHETCEVCHGDSSGTTSAVARGLYQRPPQFARDGVENLPFAYTSWVIRHGIRLTGMPAFSPALRETQIDNVALFLKRMNALTPNEEFAWRGAPMRAQLSELHRVIGGSRACVYLPQPRARPHRFISEASVTPDGVFVIEQFYNRGISEVSVLGFDSAHHRFIRTKISKDGSADIAIAHGLEAGAWAWTTIGVSTPSDVVTTVSPRADGSYAFRATNDPGAGECGPSTNSSYGWRFKGV